MYTVQIIQSFNNHDLAFAPYVIKDKLILLYFVSNEF